MKKGLMIFLGMFVFLLIGSVLASNVAYVYRNEKKIDSGFLSAFEGLDFEVDLIKDQNIKTTDFSGYGFVFIGDENLRKISYLPEMPVIVANGRYANMFGFLDRGRARQYATNSKLKIRQNGNIVEVYDQARFKQGGPSVPYYYLPTKYRAEGLQSIGFTFTKRDQELGDVVAHYSNGNNKCFFGISNSKYWTPEAKTLFDECVDFVLKGLHDVKIDTDYASSVNGVRIKDVELNEYLLDTIPVLECDKQYKIDFRTLNMGDFSETVNLEGVFGDFSWSAKKTGLGVGGSTTTGSKTITVASEDFPVGFYDIQITADIEMDETPGDNSVTRRVEVVCEEPAPEVDEDDE